MRALFLSDIERAKLLDRLSEDLISDDEFKDALRRDREMDDDPSKVLTHEEFFKYFEERRRSTTH